MSEASVSFSEQYKTDEEILVKYRVEEIAKKYGLSVCKVCLYPNIKDCDVYTQIWWLPFVSFKQVIEIKYPHDELRVSIRKSILSVADTKLMCEEFGKLFGKDGVKVEYSNFPLLCHF